MPLFEHSVFDDVHSATSAAVLLARATRNLDYEHRQLRDRLATGAGISVTEFNALVLASQGKGTLTPRMLSDSLNMSTSATTAVIDRLERAEMLVRRPNPADRRSSVIEVRPLGEQVAQEISTRYVHAMGTVASQLESQADLERLLEQLRRLAEAVHLADDAAPRNASRRAGSARAS